MKRKSALFTLLPVIAVLLPLSAVAWEQDQSQNAVAKQAQGQRQTQSAAAASSARQGQSTRVVNNIQVPSGAGTAGTAAAIGAGSGTNVTNFQAPGWSVPPVGAGGMDCPTVGIGAGGSGPFGGGGIGPSWISPDCNARKLAELLNSMGHPDMAMTVLADQYPVVRHAMQTSATQPSPATKPPASTLTGTDGRDSFCAGYSGWSAAERGRYRSQCGR